mmetsp:Transcript_3682/g.6500  ORF Transcript_3682/g.6500 Transcript_3682/m.6500 type:complete len:236 (-) Transcript_3682:1076-1783(-)
MSTSPKAKLGTDTFDAEPAATLSFRSGSQSSNVFESPASSSFDSPASNPPASAALFSSCSSKCKAAAAASVATSRSTSGDSAAFERVSSRNSWYSSGLMTPSPFLSSSSKEAEARASACSSVMDLKPDSGRLLSTFVVSLLKPKSSAVLAASMPGTFETRLPMTLSKSAESLTALPVMLMAPVLSAHSIIDFATRLPLDRMTLTLSMGTPTFWDTPCLTLLMISSLSAFDALTTA